ncbi:hypothetical protein [Lactobacillus sp. LL6]|uniref:hypothetical protein n=1 Tax=Lactobacillus sp. LL6 TaxID=2596827 RepID=UPI0011863A82|nr:hypothetical protein [Lactobacillus sp. LL6]TSO26953.1 hypothetical protein FOD82_08000 [Lactobacillus sp. LL6]
MNPIFGAMLWALIVVFIIVGGRWLYTSNRNKPFFKLIKNDVVKRKKEIRGLYISSLLTVFIGLLMISMIYYQFNVDSFAEYFFGFCCVFIGIATTLILMKETKNDTN